MPMIRCPNCGNFTPLTGQPIGGRLRVRCKKCGMTVSVRTKSGAAPAAGGAPAPEPEEAAAAFEDEAPSPAAAPADEMLVSAPEEPEPTDRGELAKIPLPVTLARLWKEKFTGTVHVTTAAG